MPNVNISFRGAKTGSRRMQDVTDATRGCQRGALSALRRQLQKKGIVDGSILSGVEPELISRSWVLGRVRFRSLDHITRYFGVSSAPPKPRFRHPWTPEDAAAFLGWARKMRLPCDGWEVHPQSFHWKVDSVVFRSMREVVSHIVAHAGQIGRKRPRDVAHETPLVPPSDHPTVSSPPHPVDQSPPLSLPAQPRGCLDPRRATWEMGPVRLQGGAVVDRIRFECRREHQFVWSFTSLVNTAFRQLLQWDVGSRGHRVQASDPFVAIVYEQRWNGVIRPVVHRAGTAKEAKRMVNLSTADVQSVVICTIRVEASVPVIVYTAHQFYGDALAVPTGYLTEAVEQMRLARAAGEEPTVCVHF